MNNKILITSLALAVIAGASYFGTGQVSADESDTNGQHPMIQALIERFNLNEEEVETFVEDHKGQMREQHEEAMQDRLDDAVENGTITEEQKALLLQKHEEHRSEMESLSREERRAKMGEHREEMQTWAEENGIDYEALHEGFWAGGPMHKGMGRGHGGMGPGGQVN